MSSTTKDYKEKHFKLIPENNFENVCPGQYIWFSKEGNVGQYRIVDVDKKNNKLTYTDGHSIAKEIDFDYSKNRNGDFFANAMSAFTDAKIYANTYFDIKNAGTPSAHVVYKSPEQIYKQSIEQMLLD